MTNPLNRNAKVKVPESILRAQEAVAKGQDAGTVTVDEPLSKGPEPQASAPEPQPSAPEPPPVLEAGGGQLTAGGDFFNWDALMPGMAKAEPSSYDPNAAPDPRHALASPMSPVSIAAALDGTGGLAKAAEQWPALAAAKLSLATPAGDVDAPRDRAGGAMVGKQEPVKQRSPAKDVVHQRFDRAQRVLGQSPQLQRERLAAVRQASAVPTASRTQVAGTAPGPRGPRVAKMSGKQAPIKRTKAAPPTTAHQRSVARGDVGHNVVESGRRLASGDTAGAGRHIRTAGRSVASGFERVGQSLASTPPGGTTAGGETRSRTRGVSGRPMVGKADDGLTPLQRKLAGAFGKQAPVGKTLTKPAKSGTDVSGYRTQTRGMAGKLTPLQRKLAGDYGKSLEASFTKAVGGADFYGKRTAGIRRSLRALGGQRTENVRAVAAGRQPEIGGRKVSVSTLERRGGPGSKKEAKERLRAKMQAHIEGVIARMTGKQSLPPRRPGPGRVPPAPPPGGQYPRPGRSGGVVSPTNLMGKQSLPPRRPGPGRVPPAPPPGGQYPRPPVGKMIGKQSLPPRRPGPGRVPPAPPPGGQYPRPPVGKMVGKQSLPPRRPGPGRVPPAPPPGGQYPRPGKRGIISPSDFTGKQRGMPVPRTSSNPIVGQPFSTRPRVGKTRFKAGKVPKAEMRAHMHAYVGDVIARMCGSSARKALPGHDIDMRKGGLHSFSDYKGDERQALPASMLPEYLAAFVGEALEHEKRECEHRKLTPKADQEQADFWAARIMGELVQYMRKNKDLARAAKGKTVAHIADILRSRGLLTPESKAATPTDRDSWGAMRAQADGKSAEVMAYSQERRGHMQEPLVKATELRLVEQPTAELAAEPRIDPFALAALQQRARLAKAANLGEGEMLTNVSHECPVHGFRDLTKTQNLGNRYTKCLCG
jgi:hypothetical protein